MTRGWIAILFALAGCAGAPEESAPVGDAERGAMVFETCASCHALEANPAEPYFGPHLADLFGRPLAADPGFQYTEALRAQGGVWTPARLADYLEAPRDFAPGTTMVQALPDPQDVADVLAYLEEALSDPR